MASSQSPGSAGRGSPPVALTQQLVVAQVGRKVQLDPQELSCPPAFEPQAFLQPVAL